MKIKISLILMPRTKVRKVHKMKRIDIYIMAFQIGKIKYTGTAEQIYDVEYIDWWKKMDRWCGKSSKKGIRPRLFAA